MPHCSDAKEFPIPAKSIGLPAFEMEKDKIRLERSVPLASTRGATICGATAICSVSAL